MSNLEKIIEITVQDLDKRFNERDSRVSVLERIIAEPWRLNKIIKFSEESNLK